MIRRAHKKTFLDDNIKVDERLLNNFPISTLSCWEHLEIWTTIQNIPIDKNFVYFIVSGGAFFKKLYDIILDAIETTNFLNKYVDDVSFIEFLFSVYSPALTRIYSFENMWINYIDKNNLSSVDVQVNFGAEEYNKRKYGMFTALDKRFPTLLIQFYDKNKQVLHDIDESFVAWLFKRCKIKAENSLVFAEIYDVMLVEAERQRNIKMHLK